MVTTKLWFFHTKVVGVSIFLHFCLVRQSGPEKKPFVGQTRVRQRKKGKESKKPERLTFDADVSIAPMTECNANRANRSDTRNLVFISEYYQRKTVYRKRCF